MNKKILIGVIALILLGVGGYFLSKNKTKSPQGNSNAVTSGAQSIKDLISAGIPQKCTFTSTEASTKTEGVTYVSGGKVRGDFSGTSNGQVAVSHMIVDGKTNYIWQDGQNTGFKTVVPEDSGDNPNVATSNTSASQQADLNEKVDYNCSAWIPDNSVFTPPSNVTFTDFSQMYVQPSSAPGAGSGSGSTSQCSYCNALTGEDKTKCLTALNCN